MGDFQNGIFGCMNDCSTCIMTTFLPCITAGQNAEAMGENCLLYGILMITPVYPVTNALIRQKIREQYNIAGSLVGDVLCHFCCGCCALIQDAQELKAHGGGAPAAVSMARE